MTLEENDKIPADVMETAAAWLMRFEKDRAPNVQERKHLKAELNTWLAADEAHRHAWELAQRAWHLAGEVPTGIDTDTSATLSAYISALKQRHSKTHLPARSGMPSEIYPSAQAQSRAIFPVILMIRATAVKFAVPAGTVMLLLLILAPGLSLWIQSDFQTATAATRSFSLDDGSQIVMSAESAVARDFFSDRRTIALRRGAAWFDVARDGKRPFIVTAGEITISVTGTAFDVAITDRTVTIALAHGSVAVQWPGKTLQHKKLEPGQYLSIDRQTGTALITRVDPALMGSWRSGRLIVHGARLADVVEAIDRYYHGTITLIGSSLANRRVTGVFNLNRPEKALRSLVSPYGVSVRKLTPWHAIVLAR